MDQLEPGGHRRRPLGDLLLALGAALEQVAQAHAPGPLELDPGPGVRGEQPVHPGQQVVLDLGLLGDLDPDLLGHLIGG